MQKLLLLTLLFLLPQLESRSGKQYTLVNKSFTDTDLKNVNFVILNDSSYAISVDSVFIIVGPYEKEADTINFTTDGYDSVLYRGRFALNKIGSSENPTIVFDPTVLRMNTPWETVIYSFNFLNKNGDVTRSVQYSDRSIGEDTSLRSLEKSEAEKKMYVEMCMGNYTNFFCAKTDTIDISEIKGQNKVSLENPLTGKSFSPIGRYYISNDSLIAFYLMEYLPEY